MPGRNVSRPSALARALAVPAVLAVLAAAGCGGDGTGGAGTTTTAPAPSAPRTTTATTPAPASRLIVGMGDQNASTFANPAFLALGIRHARLVVSYDAMSVGFERQLVDQWMAAVTKAGIAPFVAFGHSRVHPARLPSIGAYSAAVAAFRRRYPRVRTFAAWNEVNNQSQPTQRAPERAAAYFDALRAQCPGCTLVAGDVLDQAGFVGYLRRYRAALRSRPQIWGLHDYSDTNRFRTTGTRAFLRAVPGEVWLTETGGVAKFGRSFPLDLQRQARALRYAFTLADSSPRITRMYLYNWLGAGPADRFDAGLVEADGTTQRPAYRALARVLRRR
ncbi:hypothetical protein FSW04_18820 [Baekduia soli]|uniref:Asl1-like glycosyl hydrolase catalytic domain-containing protein n=1 Tax=Baekduia soli TaxID=496014 RepID=A0A5B8U9T0_9ACTN|nr:glycosyl hydrolase [Baekduia soli]QEC49422.1 hypothetical protein FSW04_18820 [Baekduia soli]